MHVASGVKLVFQAQTATCPVVTGLVVSQAAYWPRVTSVASIANAVGRRTELSMQRELELSDQHDSLGWQPGHVPDTPPVAMAPPVPDAPATAQLPPVPKAPPVLLVAPPVAADPPVLIAVAPADPPVTEAPPAPAVPPVLVVVVPADPPGLLVAPPFAGVPPVLVVVVPADPPGLLVAPPVAEVPPVLDVVVPATPPVAPLVPPLGPPSLGLLPAEVSPPSPVFAPASPPADADLPPDPIVWLVPAPEPPVPGLTAVIPPLADPLMPPVAFARKPLLCVQPSGKAANRVTAASTAAGAWSVLVIIPPVRAASLNQSPHERKTLRYRHPG